MSPERRRTVRRSVAALGLAAAAAILLVLASGSTNAGGKQKPPAPPLPANRVIAYSAMVQFDPCIRMMDADGSNDALVLEFSNADWRPTPDWSPDGQQLAFGGVSYTGLIERINVDGTGLTELSHKPGTPRWSPGHVVLEVWDESGQPITDGNGDPMKVDVGEKLAFALRTVGTNRDLFLMDPDGDGTVLDKGLVNLTNTDDVSESTGYVAWSPEASRIVAERGDGHLVVYQLGVDEDGNIGITGTRDVTWEGGWTLPTPVSSIDWANTQDKVAVNAGGQIYVLGLGPDDYSVDQLTYPGDGLVENLGIAWSPDDSKVAVVTRAWSNQTAHIAGIWTIDLQTKQETQLLSIPKSWRRMCGAIEWWSNPYGIER
jgi:Tol biopolymer transport system component